VKQLKTQSKLIQEVANLRDDAQGLQDYLRKGKRFDSLALIVLPPILAQIHDILNDNEQTATQFETGLYGPGGAFSTTDELQKETNESTTTTTTEEQQPST